LPADADTADGGEVVTGRPIVPGSIRFVTIPRSLALLVASLTALALGLATVRWGGPRVGTIVSATLVAVAACVLAVWPRPAAHAWSASQPGIVIFVCVLAVRWGLQQRYRRRVLFLPGFARAQPNGSSVQRAGTNPRSRVEPSTIDVPASS